MQIPTDARAVVTGAGSGFGRAIAEALARRKVRVLCTDVDETLARETAATIRSAGGHAEAMLVDVRDAAHLEAAASRAESLWGGTDVLVNNAGVAVTGEIGTVPLSDWKWQLDINLWGVIHGCHAFVPRMKTQRRGWILNVASIAGVVSAPTMGPYNVSKAAVIALSETLSSELASHNVVVTALCPSFFRSNIHLATRGHGVDETSTKLITEAKWGAAEIAECALGGMDRGQLYVMPQRDAKVMWRAKRVLGAGFFSALRGAARSGLLGRLVKRQEDSNTQEA